MKPTDQQSALSINKIEYPSRKVGEFKQAAYRLFARQDANKKIARYEKETRFIETIGEPCGHPEGISMVAIYKDREIKGLICNQCAV